ncbi:MAG: ribonuclease P protein component [Deltaproteobacteria bacterium]|jgi:ribonuclease P protein component|nr:ribonuclease P protein component [Deltaproteobacteria bacterium]
MPNKGEKGFSFPKDLRLLKSSDYKSFRSPHKSERISLGPFTVFIKKNALPLNRLGIIVTKKAAGNSVLRNRLKRLAREFFRVENPSWPKGLDFLFIAKNVGGKLTKPEKPGQEKPGLLRPAPGGPQSPSPGKPSMLVSLGLRQRLLGAIASALEEDAS